MAGKNTVPVTVQGHEYRIRTDADPQTVWQAAALLDETMARVRLRSRSVDSLDVVVLAALNIANSLVSLREARRPLEGVEDRLEALIELVEGVSEPAAPAP